MSSQKTLGIIALCFCGLTLLLGICSNMYPEHKVMCQKIASLSLFVAIVLLAIAGTLSGAKENMRYVWGKGIVGTAREASPWDKFITWSNKQLPWAGDPCRGQSGDYTDETNFDAETGTWPDTHEYYSDSQTPNQNIGVIDPRKKIIKARKYKSPYKSHSPKTIVVDEEGNTREMIWGGIPLDQVAHQHRDRLSVCGNMCCSGGGVVLDEQGDYIGVNHTCCTGNLGGSSSGGGYYCATSNLGTSSGVASDLQRCAPGDDTIIGGTGSDDDSGEDQTPGSGTTNPSDDPIVTSGGTDPVTGPTGP